MISQLYGKLIEKHPPNLVIDVNGVGYGIVASMHTFYQLPKLGESVKLLTHLIVREDAHVLYGFYEASERRLFRHLIKVNGVGPKLALTILSGMSAQDFVNCIQVQDASTLVRMPGVGKKTAERLIVEMRDKLGAWQSDAEASEQHNDSLPTAVSQVIEDATNALVALGYKPLDAARSIKKLAFAGSHTSEELIRLALQQMR